MTYWNLFALPFQTNHFYLNFFFAFERSSYHFLREDREVFPNVEGFSVLFRQCLRWDRADDGDLLAPLNVIQVLVNRIQI